ncbi:prolyl oligopeptidase family serine peptidase [Ammonicoccus fulvus]|uniref:Prolyl oligopeptidase family serine peptidase n=1 Tax=Ammonicoccus fulvus TaxID=3138240 RepID=A0ABZ3FJV9_9ACTN
MDLFGRPTYGASVSPDGSAFAHIIVVDGYPRAVQRYLTGTRVSASRFVNLPVIGPVTKVAYSPDSRWLACQVRPEGGERSQVWLVTNDPADSRAWRVGTDDDTKDELVGWDGLRIAVNVEHDDCTAESRLIDPVTHEVEIVDRRFGGRFIDSWAGSHLVRQGPRCDRFLSLLRNGREVVLLPHDPGSTTDPGVILDDKKPLRLHYTDSYADLYPPAADVPSWDPRGGYVRVVARSDHDADFFRLIMMTATRGGVSRRVLAERDGADLDAFEVSEDNSTVALLWNVDGGRSELQLMSLVDGTLFDPIPLDGQVASEPSLSADGRLLALTPEGPGRPRSVELCDTRTGEWVRITRPPRVPRSAEPEFRRIRARDGLELNGWLYRASEADGPGPVAVWFHGGPEGQARPEYSYVFPTLLAAGITVFAANVRGSSGFGRAYVHADDRHRRWAGITDGVDIAEALIAAGIADPRRIAATGRSYGGYLTNALIAFHPEVFTAAVAVCGMSDLQTFYANTEPWIGAAAVSKYGDPVADAELLAALSPLRKVDDIVAPLRTIHGGNDTNVPVTESRQIVEALQRRGRRADCVVVEGEGHDFTRPANRQYLADLVRDWLLESWGAGVPVGAVGVGSSAG